MNPFSGGFRAYTGARHQPQPPIDAGDGHVYGLEAPYQKTSFLGRTVQILIYPLSSPCLADVGLFVRHPTKQFPSNKESSCKLIFLYTWKTICSIDITTLHRAAGKHALCEVQIVVYYFSSLRGGRTRLTWSRSITAKSLRAQLASQGSTPSFAFWGIEFHPHTWLSSGLILILIVSTWGTIAKD